jgi:hypothetical protein
MTRNLRAGVSACLVATVVAGCGPGKIEPEVSSDCYPADLRVEVNSGTMDISWKAKCSRLISGYNIYINENPIVEKYPGSELPPTIKPFNLTPYSGDTNPDDDFEHFVADKLENGRKYYVSVRVVNPDLTLSPPSREVAVVCGPSGEIDLSIRYQSDKDGYCFAKNEYVPADDLDNDLYFYSRDGVDYLNSPVRLNGFLKENHFRRLPYKGSFGEIRMRLGGMSSSPGEERIPIKAGEWLHLSTPDGANALLNVLQVYGTGSERRVKLFFVYNSYTDEMIF